MTTTTAALENLQIIRSLMERAHIYRAVSAPAALAGGIMAILASAWPVQHALKWNGEPLISDTAFLAIWLAILGIASALNIVLLARESARRQQPLVSGGMRMALRAFTPPMLAGGCVGIGSIVFLHNLMLASVMWILCYGLALLATASFSPRSITRLGWAFVIAGVGVFFAWSVCRDIQMLASDVGPASIALGATFGLLHVVYAIAVFVSPQTLEVRPG